MRLAEINQYSVTHVPGDEAVEPSDVIRDGSYDLPQILGIQPN